MADDRDIIDSGSGVRWFLLGAAIGAGLGLLFAPHDGARTRRDLAKRGRKLRAQAADIVDDIADEVETRGRQLKESVQDLAEDVLEDVTPPRRGRRETGPRTTRARKSPHVSPVPARGHAPPLWAPRTTTSLSERSRARRRRRPA